jgi:signal transduction histidine kinase
MRVPRRPWGIRTRLLLALLGALVLAVGAMTGGFNLLLWRSLSHSASEVARARASSQVAALRISGGHVDLGETPDKALGENQFWVFVHGHAIEAPQASREVTAAAHSLAGGRSSSLDIDHADVRLYAVPVVSDSQRLGTVVAGVSLAPYEQTRSTALIGSLAFALLLLMLVALAGRWLLAAALRPVGRMTEEAADWSEHSLDRRFGLGEPHDELTRLAATLDNLLDRIAASLRREQRFSAELSHELRTPISRIVAEAEIALRRERPASAYRAALRVVLRSAKQVTSTIEALVAAAQQQAGLAHGTADAYQAAEQAAEACRPAAAEHDIMIEVDRPATQLRVGVDPELATRILQPVLENAVRYGRGHVWLSLIRDSSKVVYVVEDDGPGVDDSEREHIFEPGARGTVACGADGAGLGLALARRLARAASGEVEALPSKNGGRFAVSLPTA